MSAGNTVVLPVMRISRGTRCRGASRSRYLRDQHPGRFRLWPSICSRGCGKCRERSVIRDRRGPWATFVRRRHLITLPAEIKGFPAKSWRWRWRSTIL
jgi:hypothetical protein